MIYCIYLSILVFAMAGCNRLKSSRSPSLPANVVEDQPIIIKEGQGVILVPEGKRSLMIGASVIDGNLIVSEIEPKGKSFSVTWSDQDSWTTSVLDSAKDISTTIIDKNGDGIPDIRAVKKEGSLLRFRLEDPKWIELK